MIKVMLKGGQEVLVPNGLGAGYAQTTRNCYREEVVETNLEVKDKADYGGKVIASFKAAEVIGFSVEPDEPEA